MPKAKIVHLAPTDNGPGTGGHLPLDLHHSCLRHGYDSRLIVRHRYSQGLNIETLPKVEHSLRISLRKYGIHDGASRRMLRYLSRLSTLPDVFRMLRGREARPDTLLSPVSSQIGSGPLVFHLHGIHLQYFSLEKFIQLSAGNPIIISLRDSRFHCGNSASSWDWSLRRPTLRRNCVAIGNAANIASRKKALRGARVYLACSSERLRREVEKSYLRDLFLESRTISPGVDTDFFMPGNQSDVRRRLFLPEKAFVIAYSADHLSHYTAHDDATFRRALERLSLEHPDRSIIAIGLGAQRCAERVAQAQIRYLPYTFEKEKLRSYLQAADIYVHVSEQGTFSSAVLEAMACALPVFTVLSGETSEQVGAGYGGLWQSGDVTGLLDALRSVLSSPERVKSLGQAGRKIAQENFSLNKMCESYFDWYDMLSRVRCVQGALEFEKRERAYL